VDTGTSCTMVLKLPSLSPASYLGVILIRTQGGLPGRDRRGKRSIRVPTSLPCTSDHVRRHEPTFRTSNESVYDLDGPGRKPHPQGRIWRTHEIWSKYQLPEWNLCSQRSRFYVILSCQWFRRRHLCTAIFQGITPLNLGRPHNAH